MDPKKFEDGFTLIELLIGMAVTLIVLTGAVMVFWNIQSTSKTVDQRTNMAMNARNAMYLIESEIRMMGFNPEGNLSGDEVMDVSDNCCARGGFLTFNRNDPADIDEVQRVSIGLAAGDDTEDGERDGFADAGATSLTRRIVDDADITGDIADDIVAIRFAYAFDDDEDGNVDASANDFVQWAIDATGDGRLDTLLDTNDDGQIDANDTVGGTSITDTADMVDISKIKAVKVWLLVRSSHPAGNSSESGTFVVGDQRHTPNDDFAHTLLTTTIRCRNMF